MQPDTYKAISYTDYGVVNLVPQEINNCLFIRQVASR